MISVIEINDISKLYPKSEEYSLNNVSFKINRGDKIGIFGPNGAGKTTLISILCGIIEQSKGEIEYMKEGKATDLNSMLFKIGYVPQDLSFYSELSPWQNLMYFGSLYAIPKKQLRTKIDELLEILGLSKVANKKINTFSGGMKRRVNLAIGIINEPEILFLDEPTAGVDVQSKNAIMSYLNALNLKGTTIIYTSHHMNEGQEFCNRFVLLDKGELIVDDNMANLLKEHKEKSLESLFLKLTGIEYRDQ